MAITRIITDMTSPGIGRAIERLSFMAEFSTHFSVSLAGDVFLQACSVSSTPSANDLKPLISQPSLIAAMIKNREIVLKSQVRNDEPVAEVYVWQHQPYIPDPPAPVPQLEAWLLEELNSFEFSK